MKFYLINTSEEIVKGAKELSNLFGFEITESGVKTQINENSSCFYWEYKEGVLVINVCKKVQAFYALKEISDEVSYEGIKEGYKGERKNSFEDLNYMLDCSRNAVALIPTLEELIRHLAVMGYDSFMLYTEDTYVVENHPYFGYLRTPYTKEDIARIDNYCKIFGIELIPCIQTLAHFNSLIRHYAMSDLFDCNDILIAEEEKTYKFIEDLISTCAEYFSSRRIHIGMDEAHMLGRGKYLDKHGYKSRFDIMATHLTKVNEICKKYGLKPMMWSDMFFGLTEHMSNEKLDESIAQKVPKDVDLIYWDYYHTNEEHYNEMMKKHRFFENQVGFATGAWKWIGYTPDNRYTFATNKPSAKACLKNGIKQYIVTGWGDNGAECSTFAILPSLLYCSRINYGDYTLGANFKRSFLTLSGVKFSDFMTIDLANRITTNNDVKERNTSNRYLLYNDVLLGTLDTTVIEGQGDLYTSHARKLAIAKNKAGKWAYLFETQRALCKLLSIKAEMGVKLRSAYQSGNKEELASALVQLKKLPALIEVFYKAIRIQWHKENRPNGFDVQDLRIGALKQRVLVAIEKIEDYLAGRTTEICELNEKLLCFVGYGEDFKKPFNLCEHRWHRITSVNVND